MTEISAARAQVAAPAPSAGTDLQARRAGFGPATNAVFRQQLARARVARVPLLFVAAFQSLGILLLLRGVVDTSSELTRQQVVAGATVLVSAFVCLNLLAQRIGSLRQEGGLDYYAALDVPGAAVVLGTAASYALFALPGSVATAAAGAGLYDLTLTRLWILLAVVPLASAALAGVGALLGLLAPRPEVATVAGQLGMSLVIFVNLIPASRLPEVVRWVRVVVPSTYACDALAETFRTSVRWWIVGRDLGICAAVAVAALGLAGALFRYRASP